MTVRKFRDAIRKGHGRAILWANEHKSEELDREILRACLQFPADDFQLDSDGRDQYAVDLIHRAQSPEPIIQELLESLRDRARTRWRQSNLGYRADIATILASDGHPAAGEAVFRHFGRTVRSKALSPDAGRLVKAFGWKGVRMAARHPKLWATDPEMRAWFLVDDVKDKFGKAKANRWIARERLRDPAIERLATLMDQQEAEMAARPPYSTKETAADSLDALAARIQGLDKFRARREGRMYNHKATEAQRQEAMAQLPLAEDPIWAICLAWASNPFKPFEGDVPAVLEWLNRGDPLWYEAATTALKQMKHPAIRAAALREIRRRPLMPNVLHLFELNARPTDCPEILRALRSVKSRHGLHWHVSDLVDVARKLGRSGVPLMRWGIEHSPCSFCRGSMVRLMVRYPKTITDDELNEWLWDNVPETREFARRLLARRK